MVAMTTSPLLRIVSAAVLLFAVGVAHAHTYDEAERAEQNTLDWADREIERTRKSDVEVVVLDAQGRPVPGARVAADHVRHTFHFGCNIFGYHRLDDALVPAYLERFEQLFNFATLPFYWRGYEREQGEPNYAQTDEVVAWCAERRITMKGHPILWGQSLPRWIEGELPTPEQQKQRVTEVMQRYAGKITYWEVINEPAHFKDAFPLDPVYRWAREADPTAHLIVNDYYIFPSFYPEFYAMLEEAVANDVPFDGVGIQGHEPREMRFPLERVREVFDHYAKLGKTIHVTEFTPQSGGKPITGSHLHGNWDEAAQADYAAKFYRVCFAHPAVASVVWWDFSDAQVWLSGGGLLREDMTPKPAFEALDQLINHTWRTHAKGETDESGRYAFRGFHGIYRVTVTVDGETVERETTLGAEGIQRWVIQLD